MKNKLFFCLALLIFSTSLYGRCHISNYNSGVTCRQIEASLTSALISSENAFVSLRQSNIEAPTRHLSNRLDKYNRVTGLLVVYNESINTLRVQIDATNENIKNISKKEFELEKLKNDFQILENDISTIKAELDVMMER